MNQQPKRRRRRRRRSSAVAVDAHWSSFRAALQDVVKDVDLRSPLPSSSSSSAAAAASSSSSAAAAAAAIMLLQDGRNDKPLVMRDDINDDCYDNNSANRKKAGKGVRLDDRSIMPVVHEDENEHIKKQAITNNPLIVNYGITKQNEKKMNHWNNDVNTHQSSSSSSSSSSKTISTTAPQRRRIAQNKIKAQKNNTDLSATTYTTANETIASSKEDGTSSNDLLSSIVSDGLVTNSSKLEALILHNQKEDSNSVMSALTASIIDGETAIVTETAEWRFVESMQIEIQNMRTKVLRTHLKSNEERTAHIGEENKVSMNDERIHSKIDSQVKEQGKDTEKSLSWMKHDASRKAKEENFDPNIAICSNKNDLSVTWRSLPLLKIEPSGKGCYNQDCTKSVANESIRMITNMPKESEYQKRRNRHRKIKIRRIAIVVIFTFLSSIIYCRRGRWMSPNFEKKPVYQITKEKEMFQIEEKLIIFKNTEEEQCQQRKVNITKLLAEKDQKRKLVEVSVVKTAIIVIKGEEQQQELESNAYNAEEIITVIEEEEDRTKSPEALKKAEIQQQHDMVKGHQVKKVKPLIITLSGKQKRRIHKKSVTARKKVVPIFDLAKAKGCGAPFSYLFSRRCKELSSQENHFFDVDTLILSMMQ